MYLCYSKRFQQIIQSSSHNKKKHYLLSCILLSNFCTFIIKIKGIWKKIDMWNLVISLSNNPTVCFMEPIKYVFPFRIFSRAEYLTTRHVEREHISNYTETKRKALEVLITWTEIEWSYPQKGSTDAVASHSWRKVSVLLAHKYCLWQRPG